MATNADEIMLGRLNRLMSKENVEKSMWINRDFIFGDYFTNNQEFRKKVLDFYSQGDRKDDLFKKITAAEAIEKLKAYEEKQTDDEIKVGDEVETKDGKRFVVTTFGSGFDGDIAVGVCADGFGLGVDLKELRKTGRHFTISSILKEMQS